MTTKTGTTSRKKIKSPSLREWSMRKEFQRDDITIKIYWCVFCLFRDWDGMSVLEPICAGPLSILPPLPARSQLGGAQPLLQWQWNWSLHTYEKNTPLKTSLGWWIGYLVKSGFYMKLNWWIIHINTRNMDLKVVSNLLHYCCSVSGSHISDFDPELKNSNT